MSSWTVTALHLDDVVYPDWHPRDGVGPVFVYLVRSGDRCVLVDSGLGPPQPFIDAAYQPTRGDLGAMLRDEAATPELLIVTHLHFDHIGGAAALGAMPILVQRLEREAARAEQYTVQAFVDFAGADYELLDGDHEVAPGLRVISTPGHTPGHQSLAVMQPDGLAVIAGQAAETAAEWQAFLAGEWQPDDRQRVASLVRLRELDPVRMWFSHDIEVWERGAAASRRT